MTESQRRLLADPFRLEGEGEVTWAPPAVRNPAAVKRVVDELTRGLLPTRAEFLKWICSKLSALPTQTSTGLNAALWADNVIDVCEHYPEDLLQSATLELLKTRTFRPSPAEIVAVIEPRYGERQRMLDRAKSLVAPIEQAAKPFEPEPLEVRLRAAIDRWERNKDHPMMADRLRKTAIESEIRLAEIEKREPRDWALDLAQVERQPKAETGIPASGAPVGGPSRTPGIGAAARAVIRQRARAMEQAAVEPWQAGQPLYRHAPEEAPPPTDIPEAGDIEVEP
jgi:hypothetical protein